MRIYADVDHDGYVIGLARLADGAHPNVGAVLLAAMPAKRPSKAARLRVVGDMAQWVDVRTLDAARADKAAELRSAAAAQILSRIDEVGDLLADLVDGQTPAQAQRSMIIAFRARVRAARTALQSAQTIAEVDAVQW